MKTKFLLVLAAALAWQYPAAAAPAEPARADATTAGSAPHACCCAAAPAAAAPLSSRSLYQVDATWTDDAGAPFRLTEFRGQPVVLAMFFASCTYACPILVHDLEQIRAALAPDVRARAKFVLVSFDHARDTPAALHRYRERLGLDSGWTLLRGSDADVQELAMLVGVKYRRDANGDYSHSNLITVLNGEGEIVHQREGLQGEIAATARAITVTTP